MVEETHIIASDRRSATFAPSLRAFPPLSRSCYIALDHRASTSGGGGGRRGSGATPAKRRDILKTLPKRMVDAHDPHGN